MARHKGVPLTEEHRQRIAAGVKAAWSDPDKRQRTVEGQRAGWQRRVAEHEVASDAGDYEWSSSVSGYGYQPTDSHRKKIGDAQRRAWQDPEVRERRLAAIRAHHAAKAALKERTEQMMAVIESFDPDEDDDEALDN